MKTLIALAMAVLTGVAGLHADEWMTDYDAAVKKAGAENKMVLLDFTGSDWCSWCVRLDKDTFSKPEFRKFADDELVLVEVDFPQRKEQSAQVKKQNEELKDKFGVQGFPTLVLLDSEGKEVARNVGYLEGGPEAFEEWVKKAKKS